MNRQSHLRSRPKKWTAVDHRRLRALYPSHPQKEVARILGRTLCSVQSRSQLLHLKRNRNYRRWLPAELRQLRALYPDQPTAALARRFARTVRNIYGAAVRYGLKKNSAFVARYCRMMPGTQIGVATQFKKGHVPANKGLRRPGWAAGRMRETQFKKGDRPRNYLPIGTVKPDSDGYLRIKIADGLGGGGNQKVWAFVHKRIWEAAHGRIPKGHRIWWKDGDHANCALENLELLTDQEHMARTTIHNLPPALKETIHLNAALKRKIRRLEGNGKEQNLRPTGPSLRDSRSLEGQRLADGG